MGLIQVSLRPFRAEPFIGRFPGVETRLKPRAEPRGIRTIPPSEKVSKPFVDEGSFVYHRWTSMKLMLISLFSALAIASPAFAGRKVVQIAAQGDRIYVLCDDGTVWWAINAGPSVPKPIWNEIETPP